MFKTRLAPSPTGALHLGNARTFLINWLMARQSGWKVILRIEDLDGPRIKHGSAQELVDDLQWLGIDWDEGPIYQSSDVPKYQKYIDQLMSARLAYPCVCTRKEIELAASAPHAEDGATIYPGTCRGRFESAEMAEQTAKRLPAIRFAVPPGLVEWDDQFAGHQQYDVSTQLGDFVIAKGDGTPAYQLAVVVDDVASGVTHIVRGDDLLDSTPRQLLLYRSLGFIESIPQYFHLPLIVGTDGRRLAKRHGDTRLSYFRERGIPASRILQMLARWCGIEVGGEVDSAGDLIGGFSLENVPKSRIVLDDSAIQKLEE